MDSRRASSGDPALGAPAIGIKVADAADWLTEPSDVQAALDTLASDVLYKDGSRGLTGDWDAGSHKITAQQLSADIADGTTPLIVASTTLVTNLNADMLDGKHVGTSGNVVPVLDGANTFSNHNILSGSNEMRFNSANNNISATSFTLTVEGALTIDCKANGAVRGSWSNVGLDVVGKCQAANLIADGAASGVGGVLVIGNDQFTPIGSSTIMTCLVGGKSGPATAVVKELIPCYSHGTLRYIPLL